MLNLTNKQTKKKMKIKSLKLMSWQNVPSPDEDFHIWVPPGTYAVTAGVADSEQQTLLVDLKAGETFKLTFNF